MLKNLLLLGTLILAGCSSSHSDEAGLTPIPRNAAEPTTTEEISAAPVSVASTVADTSAVVENNTFPVRLAGKVDTNLRLEDIPLERFGRFRLRKIPTHKEEGYWAIAHPDYTFKIGEMPFDTAVNVLTYKEGDSSVVKLINEYPYYGTNGTIPKSQISRFTFTPTDGDLTIVLPRYYEDLFNLNFKGEGKTGNPQAYRVGTDEMLIVFKSGAVDSKYVVIYHFNAKGEVIQRVVGNIAPNAEP